jgi:hypothetical protein
VNSRILRCPASNLSRLPPVLGKVVLWPISGPGKHSTKKGICPELSHQKSLKHILVGGSNPLKNISQMGLFFPIDGNIKHVPNHQAVFKTYFFTPLKNH